MQHVPLINLVYKLWPLLRKILTSRINKFYIYMIYEHLCWLYYK